MGTQERQNGMGEVEPISQQNQHIYGQRRLVRDLPDGEPTDEELIIQIGKHDESLSPLTEDEVDEYLASAKEANLRNAFEFNEDGLIIDEFPTPSGECFYQPRKKDKTWLSAVYVLPTMFPSNAHRSSTPICRGKHNQHLQRRV